MRNESRHCADRPALRIVPLLGPTGGLATATPAGRPQPATHPDEAVRTQASQRHVRDEKDRDETHQPWPHVHRDARLATPFEERVARTFQRTAARQLGQLAEQGLIDAQVAELLRIRYH